MARYSTRNVNSRNSAKHLVQNRGSASKILIVPKCLTETSMVEDTAQETIVIKLRSPKHGTGEMFLFSKGRDLFHLMKYGDEYQSWLFNNNVCHDGTITMAAPIDPLFLILPYLKKTDKYQPLNQILVDDKFPDCRFLLLCDRLLQELHLIANVKETKDFTAYCYNAEKCITWLSEKVTALSRVLQEKQIHVSLGAHSATFIRNKKELSSDVDYLKFACGMVADYLQEDVAQELSESLGLTSNKSNDESACVETPPPKRVKLNAEEPTEDYSTTAAKNEQKISDKPRKLTVSQRTLSKVDKTGMKKISSFFSKNATK